MPIHPSQRAQVALLLADEAPVDVPSEYSNYADVFSPESAVELPEHTGINDHPINLVDGQKPPYGPIHNLGPMELETLKTYIETNLANGFIRRLLLELPSSSSGSQKATSGCVLIIEVSATLPSRIDIFFHSFENPWIG